MRDWWVREAPAAPAPEARPQAVAYYRHSAQDRQENSIPIQREQVEKWAQEHRIRIIREFADHGKSGLSVEHRDAFNDMLENWVKKRDDFEFILVLDVSRWGRFQDTDLSATYSAQCTRHGKKVVYTTLGLPKKDDPLHSMLVGFERYRAAQYSRELSDKTWRGLAKLAHQGFHLGGHPPYALQRLLLSEDGRPVQVLKRRERKNIQNQRVTLAPGDPGEIAVVRRIFEEVATQRLTPYEIAIGLNRDLILSPRGTPWDAPKVGHILGNKLYIGTMVYNKSTKRMQSSKRRLPRGEWIETPSAFQGILSKELFDRAQAERRVQKRRCSPETLLGHFRRIYQRSGTLSLALINSDPLSPCVATVQKNMGSVASAFQKLFPELHEGVIRTVRDVLSALVGRVEEYEDFLVLDRQMTVLVQPSVPIPLGLRPYWPFQTDSRPIVDMTLGIPLSGDREPKILGYFAFPRLFVPARHIRVYGPMDWRIELFGFQGLDFFKDLLS